MKLKYTLREFFDISPITQEAVANEAKIKPTMLRQYIGGYKPVSDEKLKRIEVAINKLGKRMVKIKIKP